MSESELHQEDSRSKTASYSKQAKSRPCIRQLGSRSTDRIHPLYPKAEEDHEPVMQQPASMTKSDPVSRRPRQINISPQKPLSSFLASEASKVGTPPPSARGFFFNTQEEATSPGWKHTETRFSGAKNDMVLGEEREWFRVEVDDLVKEDSEDEPDHEIPEHFLTSPLCPRHPKHRSGGTGVCIYHGRNQDS